MRNKPMERRLLGGPAVRRLEPALGIDQRQSAKARSREGCREDCNAHAGSQSRVVTSSSRSTPTAPRIQEIPRFRGCARAPRRLCKGLGVPSRRRKGRLDLRETYRQLGSLGRVKCCSEHASRIRLPCYGENASGHTPRMRVQATPPVSRIETSTNLRATAAGLMIAEVPGKEGVRLHGASNLHASWAGWPDRLSHSPRHDSLVEALIARVRATTSTEGDTQGPASGAPDSDAASRLLHAAEASTRRTASWHAAGAAGELAFPDRAGDPAMPTNY